MGLGTLKTADCVSEPCVVRTGAPVFGEEPYKHNGVPLFTKLEPDYKRLNRV